MAVAEEVRIVTRRLRAHPEDSWTIQRASKDGAYEAIETAINELEPDETIELVKSSGLRGRGGAGFPTGLKWSFVPKDIFPKYIVVNHDEGEPGTFKDRELAESDPHQLIEGIAIAAWANQANHAFIYCRGEFALGSRRLTRAIAEAYEKGFLGKDIFGSGFDLDITLHRGAGAYICGEETSLLDSLEGKRGMVRAKPPLPAISGLFGKPTVINNVLSFAAVPTILDKGGAFYKNYGMGRSRGTMPLQLAGNIKRGGLVEKAFGLTLRQVIEEFGGGTASGRPLRAVQVGGPLGAYFPPSLLDTPIDYEAMAAQKGMLGHGGIVVFDDSVDMAQQARFAFEFCATESCGKCTPCRIGSTRGVEVIDAERAELLYSRMGPATEASGRIREGDIGLGWRLSLSDLSLLTSSLVGDLSAQGQAQGPWETARVEATATGNIGTPTIEVSVATLNFDMREAWAVMEKANILCALFPDGVLNVAAIEALAPRRVEEDVVWSLLGLNKRQAIAAIAEGGGAPTGRIIGALATHVETLSRLNALLANTTGVREVARRLGAREQYVRTLMPYARLYPRREAVRRTLLLNRLDRAFQRGAGEGVLEALIALW